MRAPPGGRPGAGGRRPSPRSSGIPPRPPSPAGGEPGGGSGGRGGEEPGEPGTPRAVTPVRGGRPGHPFPGPSRGPPDRWADGS
ncbi:hypothetical protein CW362_37385 [Streptomyces populi]|uniref:Uncharacterized protein n=1 Tax=Streptomyces populi TaxID=2058924 RepID=A0A2I0SDG3_9ACTN|nr:hypothetical protein CW362_37385 [Streptomyces populi]